MATAELQSSLDGFITHWSKAEASERANAQPFLIGLAHILGVPEPSNTHADGYTFEFPVKIPTRPDTFTDGRVDLCRRGSFVLEGKQFVAQKAEPTDLTLDLDPASGKRKAGPVRRSDARDDAMWKARGQAERYARHLPADEPPSPFVLVVNVGQSIEGKKNVAQDPRRTSPRHRTRPASRRCTHFPRGPRQTFHPSQTRRHRRNLQNPRDARQGAPGWGEIFHITP